MLGLVTVALTPSRPQGVQLVAAEIPAGAFAGSELCSAANHLDEYAVAVEAPRIERHEHAGKTSAPPSADDGDDTRQGQTGCGPCLACRRIRSHGQVIRAHTMTTSVAAVSR